MVMKAVSAIVILLLLAVSMSASGQIQLGPQYRGLYIDDRSIYTARVAVEAHFLQGGLSWRKPLAQICVIERVRCLTRGLLWPTRTSMEE